MPRSRLPPFPAASAHLRQVGGHVRRCRHAVLDLRVRDGAVLLSQMQPELTLVAEVQVAFLTLEKEKKKGGGYDVIDFDFFFPLSLNNIFFSVCFYKTNW